MSELEKLNRLRHIIRIQHALADRSDSNSTARTQSAGLHLSLSSGRSRYLEYAGDPSRNDQERIVAPTNQYAGHDDSREYVRSRREAERNLNDFVSAMDIPELRDEFFSAVAKIARKARHAKDAAHEVQRTTKPDGVKANRLGSRWSGNALFELELNDYHLSDDDYRQLAREARKICDELGLLEIFGYDREHNFPSYHEVNELYHQRKKDDLSGPK